MKYSFLYENLYSGQTFVSQCFFLNKFEKLNENLGSLSIRTLASKNNSDLCFTNSEQLSENIVLDLEYSVLIPIL